jgi:hypothetical protein
VCGDNDPVRQELSGDLIAEGQDGQDRRVDIPIDIGAVPNLAPICKIS